MFLSLTRNRNPSCVRPRAFRGYEIALQSKYKGNWILVKILKDSIDSMYFKMAVLLYGKTTSDIYKSQT